MNAEKAIVSGLASAAALVAGGQGALAQDFTGGYAGLSLNTNNGAFPFVDSGDDYKLESGAVVGGFIGTRWASGSYVLGTELAFQGNVSATSSGDPYSFDNLVDAKFSFGMPYEKTLFYGFAGISGGTMSTQGGDLSYTAFGANFGLGADYLVSDKFSVGVEYTGRVLSGYDGENVGSKFNNGTLALRASYHF